jgi:hypothetical protein
MTNNEINHFKKIISNYTFINNEMQLIENELFALESKKENVYKLYLNNKKDEQEFLDKLKEIYGPKFVTVENLQKIMNSINETK